MTDEEWQEILDEAERIREEHEAMLERRGRFEPAPALPSSDGVVDRGRRVADDDGGRSDRGR